MHQERQLQGNPLGQPVAEPESLAVAFSITEPESESFAVAEPLAKAEPVDRGIAEPVAVAVAGAASRHYAVAQPQPEPVAEQRGGANHRCAVALAVAGAGQQRSPDHRCAG